MFSYERTSQTEARDSLLQLLEKYISRVHYATLIHQKHNLWCVTAYKSLVITQNI